MLILDQKLYALIKEKKGYMSDGNETWFEKHEDITIIIFAIASLIILYAIAIVIARIVPYTPTPTPMQGISIFAILYLIAQLSERVTELFSNLSIFGGGSLKTADINERQRLIDYIDTAIKADINDTFKSTGTGEPNETLRRSIEIFDKSPIIEMRKCINMLEKRSDLDSKTRVIRLWVFASGIAVVVTSLTSGLFGIIGVTYIPHVWDSFFTGIIIGGGTKPLHDLITYIETKAV